MSNYREYSRIRQIPQKRKNLPNKRRISSSSFNMREYDLIIFVSTIVLVSIGLIMVLSASHYASLNIRGDIFAFFTTQALGVGLGLFGMFFAATIDFRIFAKFSFLFYVIANFMLVDVLFRGITVGGATRWINYFGVQFQPSEFAKAAVILFLATYIASDTNRVSTLKGLFGSALIVGIPIALVALGGNLSTVLILAALGFIMIFLASPYFWRFFAVALVGVAALVAFLVVDYFVTGGFRGMRFIVWQDPFSDPQGIGFQTVQSLYAIASGGLFGLGLGNSVQKLFYLPEAHNDFIFAILVEELGLFGGFLVLLFFGILVWRGVMVAIKSKSILGCLIASGIVTLISVQVIINVGVVTNTIPNTGIPLPFISYGGTSIAVTMTMIGVLLSVSRGQLQSKKPSNTNVRKFS